MEHKLIVENWRNFINENNPPPPGSEDIETLGELYDYLQKMEPSKVKKIFAKYGKTGIKLLGTIGSAFALTGVGFGVGAAAVAGSALAGKAVEDMLVASALMFANVEDGTYEPGSIISFFDLDDKVQDFLRDVEHGIKGSQAGKVSTMEKEAIDKMIKHVKEKAASFPADTPLSQALSTTTELIMNKQFRDENKIEIDPV
jgi:hypothetical protein